MEIATTQYDLAPVSALGGAACPDAGASEIVSEKSRQERLKYVGIIDDWYFSPQSLVVRPPAHFPRTHRSHTQSPRLAAR